MNDRTKRRVVCAAVRKGDFLILGARHFDMTMHKTIQQLGLERRFMADGEQGFIDQWGKFMTRQEAFVVASDMEQILGEPNIEGTLFSEDLY